MNFLQTCESFTKVTSAIVILTAILTALNSDLSRLITIISAERFGATGVIKYDLGTRINNNDQTERFPTSNFGDLFLLRGGAREYNDLQYGDIVQAKSTKNFREFTNSCVKNEVCGSSSIVFRLQQGQCAVVLEKLYEDNGDDIPNETNDKLAPPKYKDRLGGWIRVATASCGLFN